MRPIRAHPRSRGENHCAAVYAPVATGSSPLTRGKLALDSRRRRQLRLIPAHAGKTKSVIMTGIARAAHPRSRGENVSDDGTQSRARGSSPLTRGKRAGRPSGGAAGGLIPAHAGKTGGSGRHSWQCPAHPRSRGENSTSSASILTLHGSSPLTRGKRRRCTSRSASGRLIPAHAGKTWREEGRRPPTWAHPRSRGENPALQKCFHKTRGSSPLTRGKHLCPHGCASPCCLIPAHAGKTLEPPSDGRPRGPHPRSRGENTSRLLSGSVGTSSSPLTRGKHRFCDVPGVQQHLIPAHAGKTPCPAGRPIRGVAHPRSRGENTEICRFRASGKRSSPLTRGKHSLGTNAESVASLIPAHAGKTQTAGPERRSAGTHPRSRGENTRGRDLAGGPVFAHPRSRGENTVRARGSAQARGSSPLTRGKHHWRDGDRRRVGLIPAHAGKTRSQALEDQPRGPHPRSRGENTIRAVPAAAHTASSPLTRGKHTSRPALLLRRSIRSWKPLSLPSPLEVTQFGSLAQLTRRRIRFGVLASSFRVVGAHHECESIEVNGLPGIAPRQEGESLLVARTKDHDSPTRFHVLSDDVPQALAYTGAERPHEDPRGNLHEPPRHVTSQPLGHRGQDQDDHQESLSS